MDAVASAEEMEPKIAGNTIPMEMAIAEHVKTLGSLLVIDVTEGAGADRATVEATIRINRLAPPPYGVIFSCDV